MRGNQLAFGSFGIKSLDTHWITARQIEAARVAMTLYMQREGQSWIRIFPDKPVTKKPADVRMGKGKGTIVMSMKEVLGRKRLLVLMMEYQMKRG